MSESERIPKTSNDSAALDVAEKEVHLYSTSQTQNDESPVSVEQNFENTSSTEKLLEVHNDGRNYYASSSETNEAKFVNDDGTTSLEILSQAQMEIKEGAGDSDLFIIQNSSGLEIDSLDSELLSQVKKAIEESGNDSRSVMIVNNDDEKGTTTYIIDVADKSQTSELTLQTGSVSLIENCKLEESQDIMPSLFESTPSSVVTSLVDVITTSQSASTSMTAINPIEIKSPPPTSVHLKDQIDSIISTSSDSSLVIDSTSVDASQELKNLVPLSSHLETTHQSTAGSSPTSVTTSQVAEQLINIAKRMMEDESQASQKISVDESLGKIVINSPDLKQSGEKSTPDPVITMYLSSPNDLKCKLNKLKTDSPVILMQTSEQSLSFDENKENPPQDLNNANENCKSMDSENISSVSQEEGKLKSDGIVAALSSISTGGVVYRCSECCYSSHNKHYYKQHVDLVHNEDRPYKCPFCDYAGKRRHALLEHMVVHSNQRPYTCNHCNATFRKKGHLTNHVKLHMSHRLVHCGVCQIQLPDTEAFEAHLHKIHRTDKLYKCKLCDHTVVDRNSMLAHLATHNESVVFSCPYCATYFGDEKTLLSHMTDAHKVSIHTATIDASNELNRKTVANIVNESEGNLITNDVKKVSTNTCNPSNKTGQKSKGNQAANIVCSECGFICTDTHIMKKHMWIHIDSTRGSCVQLKEQADTDKKSSDNSDKDKTGSNNAMGVLKMNVVSGMKSLPDNIVYQCTTCKFTSKDNSVFIKHMLLHKTQQRKQEAVMSDGSKVQGLDTSTTQAVSSAQISNSQSSAFTSSVDKKPDSSVPFMYDQSSGRYRCLICGYHCDFQRTIKAHIWKHSGNQNIDYPVFEQGKKNPSSSSTYFNSSTIPDVKPVMVSKVDTVPTPAALPPPPPVSVNLPPTQNVKTSTGKMIQLLPFKPPIATLTGRNKSEEVLLQKLNEKLPLIPNNDQKLKVESNVALTIAPASASDESIETKPNFELQSSSSPVPMNESVLQSITFSDDKNIIPADNVTASTAKNNQTLLGSSSVEIDLQTIVENRVDGVMTNDLGIGEGCTEPSIVVEVVDSVPSDLNLTDATNQQISTPVPDYKNSDSDVKLVEFSKKLEVEDKDTQKEECVDLETGIVKQVGKYNLRKPKESASSTGKNLSSRYKRSTPLKQSEKLNQDTYNDTDNYSGKRVKTSNKEEVMIDDTNDKSDEDSDETASSDEVASGEEGTPATTQPKSGICSSLLAVIEQLRERSRSEDLIRRSSKRSRKSGWSTEVMNNYMQMNNIEKINVPGEGMKFRCRLCHYTSFRISNMKIHMKTHRQKKPSECSLCDFASASSELLQEHMLQHCKVRTYTCKFCDQSFNHKSTLRAHMRAHKEHEPFLCAYCVFETTNPNEFREHMHVHSGCSSRLRCPGCDHVMNSKDELTPHLMKCKGKGNESESSSTESDKNAPPPPSPSKSENRNKPKKKEVATNQTTLEKDGADLPKLESSTASAVVQHSCVVSGCTFSSSNLKELQEHLSVHCNPSLMLCDLCDFKALHSRSLKSHMKRHANDQRYVQQPLEQYKCNLCGYVCHHLPSLKSHMWRHASDQSYSYEFTNDVINAAIDHDSRTDGNNSQPDDPELLHRFINSESRIMEGELTNFGKGDGQRPTCWVRFCCCSCGFETINKAKLNIHMRSHSDVIQKALDVSATTQSTADVGNKPKGDKSTPEDKVSTTKSRPMVSSSTEDEEEAFVPPMKKMKEK